MNKTMQETASRLRLLEGRKPTWRSPDDEIVAEVIVPALQVADHFDCMVGYFGGDALRELSHGLAAYVFRSNQPLRLLVSPVLSDSDLEAVRLGIDTPADILSNAIEAAFADEVALASALAQHTKQCFAYLLATNRLLIKVVLVQHATFHLKEWIFRADQDIVVLSGSANFTGRALLGNVERLNLHRSWRGGDSETACKDVVAEFRAYWSNSKPHAIVVDLPIALREDLIESYDTRQPPTESDYDKALKLEGRLHRTELRSTIEVSAGQECFTPPPDLVWEAGRYSHQGAAVLRWEEAGRHGILAMATGSGKTITALLCAWRLWREVRRLVIVIAVPTLPLISQWADECREFGLEPYIAGSDRRRRRRLREIDERLQLIELGVGGVEVLIVTNDFLSDPEFRKLIESYLGPMMLIADEVHNLGGGAFLSTPPHQVEFRLGLSATPERQYDPAGTAELIEYFGEIVFEFSLADAIGICLVPYDYHLHAVGLKRHELEEYRRLTDKLRRLSLSVGSAPSIEEEMKLQLFRNRRRLVLEAAEEKLERLSSLLADRSLDGVMHTLVYCTDKNPKQLEAVNRIVDSLGLSYHQITAQETRRATLVESVLSAFRGGSIRVLTAKRVLDEGLNLPEISVAIILASTTVERQWVQRRGRVLRMCAGIAKEYATIHDFLVLPPPGEPRDEDIKRMIQGELARCDEFTNLARNRAANGGPREILQDVRLEYIA